MAPAANATVAVTGGKPLVTCRGTWWSPIALIERAGKFHSNVVRAGKYLELQDAYRVDLAMPGDANCQCSVRSLTLAAPGRPGPIIGLIKDPAERRPGLLRDSG